MLPNSSIHVLNAAVLVLENDFGWNPPGEYAIQYCAKWMQECISIYAPMSISWTSHHFHPYCGKSGENDMIANLEASLLRACMDKEAKVQESEATILQGLKKMMGWVIIYHILMLLSA